jgi:membrane-anchored protein YejM (alkaline phosphatase superfamily)
MLLGIVGLRYLWDYRLLAPSAGWAYATLAFVGHLSALAYLPLLAVLLPLIVLVPHARIVVPVAVAVASAVLSLLVLDTLVFVEDRYHVDVATLALLAPTTWAFVAVYFVVGAAIEGMVAVWVWRSTVHPLRRTIGPYVALGLASCFVGSHLTHAWADAHYFVPVTAFARYLPLYFPLHDTGFQQRLGLLDRVQDRESGLAAALRRPPSGELNYPLAPLRCVPRGPVVNVLLIVIDAMRADALVPDIAPSLVGLANGAVRFDRHYSGGNSSRAGMFSLFYGLPPTYWEAFARVGRPPVLIDMFQERGYQLGIFSSTPVYRAVGLDRTALARVPHLREKTVAGFSEGSSGTDRMLSAEWIEWLDRRDKARPFFGFLYYDAPVALDAPQDYPPVVSVPHDAPTQTRRRARYLTAVHYVDSLVGTVLADLERRKLADHTVVVVTSDHGMEFDENQLGFTGHGTAFSAYQMRVPLVIRWPGRAPGRVERRTSHNDLAPTLLAGVFGCANPPSDYGSGHDLFAGPEWQWLVAAGYSIDFAVIEPDRVTVVWPFGYEVRDADYRLIPRATLPRAELRAALQEMTRFYR